MKAILMMFVLLTAFNSWGANAFKRSCVMTGTAWSTQEFFPGRAIGQNGLYGDELAVEPNQGRVFLQGVYVTIDSEEILLPDSTQEVGEGLSFSLGSQVRVEKIKIISRSLEAEACFQLILIDSQVLVPQPNPLPNPQPNPNPIPNPIPDPQPLPQPCNPELVKNEILRCEQGNSMKINDINRLNSGIQMMNGQLWNYQNIEMQYNSCRSALVATQSDRANILRDLEAMRNRKNSLDATIRDLDLKLREMREYPRSWVCRIKSRGGSTLTGYGDSRGRALIEALKQCDKGGCGKKKWDQNFRCEGR